MSGSDRESFSAFESEDIGKASCVPTTRSDNYNISFDSDSDYIADSSDGQSSSD